MPGEGRPHAETDPEGEHAMTTLTAAQNVVRAPALPAPVPLRELVPWAIFAGLMLMLVLYFVGVEQGALSVLGGHWVHEFVHDGRHVLAFPCH
jgi:hypothetical protein